MFYTKIIYCRKTTLKTLQLEIFEACEKYYRLQLATKVQKVL